LAIDAMDAKVIYLGTNEVKKSATGRIEMTPSYVKVNLNPSKRRSKFNVILLPWDRIIKIIVY